MTECHKSIGGLVLFFVSILLQTTGNSETIMGVWDDESYNTSPISVDTIPLKDRYGDFITDEYYNPFDITPSIVKQTVEYDFVTGQYVVMEKIGDEYYRTPSYLTLEEYLKWQQKKQEQEYFNKLSGIKAKDFSKSLKMDPMAEINIEEILVDRLFGGTEISIKPTGNVDLTFGVDYQDIQNPNISRRAQRQGGFDFDMDINMGVEGKIGDKMNLGFNYNTQASFDFDNRLNLGYLSDAFDEDDIIKSIEAGNVSLPLKSQLIQGSENLFGLKTQLQFGKFWVTALAAQSRSEQESLSLENGKLVREFELRPDDYDENRHFFISHYNRDNYENALQNIPQVRSLMRIINMEVWVTNDQNSDLRNSTTVAAISYLGESELQNFSDPNSRWVPIPPSTNFIDVDGKTLPNNKNSDLFRELINDIDTRKIINTSAQLSSRYGLTQVRDFEVQSMRKLEPNEYTFHPELGFVSLNTRLRPNQVLGVAYEYTYSINGGEVYKVGEITNESNRGGLSDQGNPEPEDVVYVKLLKSSNQRVDLPSWNLMMKNVYSLNTSQLTQEDFELDIFFEDFSTATLKRYIPEIGFRNIPLLTFFQLDRLSVYGDPQEDGIFDYVPGITVNSRTGSIIFPVLEPFGNSLFDLLGKNQELFDKYGYPELYNNTVTQARQTLDKNRFVIKGKLRSSASSEISLGAFNIPQGSVTVRAGSQILREGIDYDIDYGIGRIKILNDAYLQQGVPIKVSYEDQGLFSLQQKTMLALRAEYRFNENFVLGGTYMRLFERPFTQKVNIGEDPINNRMFGLDLNFTTEAPFLTKLVDKIPFLSTNEKSTINFSAEVAALKPGHSGAINVPGESQGVVSIDDFEGASSSIPLGSRPNLWTLASTPSTFRESGLSNDLNYGVNRALINWYVVDDRRVRTSEDQSDPYARLVDQTELFQRQIDVSQIPDLLTFDMTYYPEERGPYNFDLPNGTAFSAGLFYDERVDRVKLKNPRSRWAGIMRYLPNNDFEAANYEYIEFWMLNPFMPRRDGEHKQNENGIVFINLGNVSEDILKDNLQFYENSIPTPEETVPEQPTAWGNVPLSIPNVKGFDLQNQQIQDLGLDGLDDTKEREKFSSYIQQVEQSFRVNIANDPSNDNFVSYLNTDVFGPGSTLLDKYRYFNHPQGNAPVQSERIGLGNPVPDAEDLNDNRSLEQSESYYEYAIQLSNNNGEIQRSPTDFITDETTIVNKSTGEREKWYRFQIPVMTAGRAVNDIQGFRSIQFIRMYMTGFETPKTFRLAEFELVRNQWRRLPFDPLCLGDAPPGSINFVVDEVGIQENSNKTPFNYVLPKGIKQERIFNTFSNILQDENALNVRLCNFPDSCEAMISKLTELDIRLFERLQMFVHAEGKDITMKDKDLSVFIRLGKDFYNNYYEYEIPLTLSDSIAIRSIDRTTNFEAYADEVWRPENKFDFLLSLFTDAKKERNVANVAQGNIYQLAAGDPENPQARVKIKGNPSLGNIKGMIIGIRNISDDRDPKCAEIWINELRLLGLQDRGGVSGVARVDMQLADFGNVTMSGNFSSLGWGQIDQQLMDRQLERIIEYDFAANLQLGKFFPQEWGIRVPFYYQYAKTLKTPEYDPYELDLRSSELLENPNLNEEQRLDINERGKEVTSISSYNFTNVRKERTGGAGNPMPWDIENLSAGYSFSRTTHRDYLIKKAVSDDQRADLAYTYSTQAKPIQPFKNLEGSALRWIKEINFNPIPNSFGMNTQLRRFKSRKLFRLPDPSEGFEYAFDDQRFDWTRNYSLQWDLAKSLKFSYDASAVAVVDELKQVGVAPTADERRWEDPFGNDVSADVANNPSYPGQYRGDNFRELGRLKNFNQGVSVNYNLPLRYFPGLDWISSRAQYNASFNWTASSLSTINLGNVIQNQQSRSLNTTLDFVKLYEKIPYLKAFEGPQRANVRNRTNRETGAASDREKPVREPSVFEKIFVRPLLSVREVKINYREDLSTVVPGFTLSPKYLGIAEGAPGWGFVFGAQPDISIENPDNWLRNAASNDWISSDRFQNQQVLQNSTQKYDARIDLEPWKDFAIDVDFSKTYQINHAEDFINTSSDPSSIEFKQLALRDFGSYEVSYSGLSTLFDSDINGLFTRLEENRKIISSRLPNSSSVPDPHAVDLGYTKGYGRQHNDVLIPAFIAAYTNTDANVIAVDITDDIARRGYLPKPNWRLTYNGLSKLPWFQEAFSSISVTHGYKSALRVSRFNTDLQYDPLDPYYIDQDISTKNYFARFEIPEVIISEQFQPIIGIDMKTQNNINIDFEFAKTRNLQFSTGLGQLTEGRSTEYTFGFGWTLDNVNIGFLTGKKKARRNQRTTEEPPPDDAVPVPDPNQRGGVNNTQNKLTIAFNIALRDDVTYIHELDDGATAEPTRGLKTLRIGPTIDYVINKNFSLRFFTDYNKTRPYLSTSYPILSIQGGLTARFTLD